MSEPKLGTFTNKLNLYKPIAGESGIADDLNSNLDKIDLHGHSEYALKTELADVNHTHSEYAENSLVNAIQNSLNIANQNIQTIQNNLNLLMPDLQNVEIQANFTNLQNGLRINCYTTPSLFIINWNIKIRLSVSGSIVYDENHANSNIFIQHHEMPGIQNSQVIHIEITLRVGQATKTVNRTHNYVKTNSHIDVRLDDLTTQIQNQMTAGEIVHAMIQDTEFINIITNSLQHSNSLAQRVAELSKNT